MPGVISSVRVLCIDQANIKLFVTPSGRFQHNLFMQRVLVAGPLPQHGAQHVNLVRQEQIRALIQFSHQHQIKTHDGEENQKESRQRIAGRQAEG